MASNIEFNMQTPYLFLHGGPGMNSIAEERILAPLFLKHGAKIEFWNEPSKFRPNGPKFFLENTFANSTESAEKKLHEMYDQMGAVHLVAHSFGANHAIKLARVKTSQISSVTLICPALAVLEAFKNVFSLALNDFKFSDPKKASQLLDCVNKINAFGDSWFLQALSLSLENPLLMNHYWLDKSKKEKWMAILASCPEASFDVDSLFANIKTFNFNPLKPSAKLNIPVTILLSSQDPISNRNGEIQLASLLFEEIELDFMNNCGHFPHIEDPAVFVSRILKRNSSFDFSSKKVQNYSYSQSNRNAFN